MSKFESRSPNTQPLVINMTATPTTNGAGDATVTFTTPFPNGLYGFQLTEATNPASLGAVVLKAFPGSSSRLGVAFRVYASTTGAVIASFPVTVNVTAFGW